jgi:allophanate hydrolase subunit 1
MLGLGLVPGLIVVPHAGPAHWTTVLERSGRGMPAHLGVLGVAERTAAISRPDEPGVWDVAGEGEVRWLAADADPASTLVVASGGSLRLPA